MKKTCCWKGLLMFSFGFWIKWPNDSEKLIGLIRRKLVVVMHGTASKNMQPHPKMNGIGISICIYHI